MIERRLPIVLVDHYDTVDPRQFLWFAHNTKDEIEAELVSGGYEKMGENRFCKLVGTVFQTGVQTQEKCHYERKASQNAQEDESHPKGNGCV